MQTAWPTAGSHAEGDLVCIYIIFITKSKRVQTEVGKAHCHM